MYVKSGAVGGRALHVSERTMMGDSKVIIKKVVIGNGDV